ncbi:hypothetical protein M514_08872 [Trichuris suis]|uniref:Uncharacterized protein n=1 Tax=Trichuris suis TaxID=68888 RepID=A0A085LZ48_9BILA|nr:hypothetical protein M513_08872 [Trichuris suis]KFD66926.1 hypothetical protein M514_08872 [Trichuris suis]
MCKCLEQVAWFQRFKRRHNFHNVKVSGEIACADIESAVAFKDELDQPGKRSHWKLRLASKLVKVEVLASYHQHQGIGRCPEFLT